MPHTNRSRIFGAACALATVTSLYVGTPDVVLAYSGGIASETFPIPAQGCNFCHTGGVAPTVELLGPTSVAPGSTNEYTFRIFEVAFQDYGGLNAEIADGTLTTGGSFAAGTQVIANSTSGLDEVTHNGAKAASGGMVEFSFLWTAPASFSSATLNVWGNAVELNSSTGGDRGEFASLVINSSSAPTATPTATATATATPTATAMDPCGVDIDPRHPESISDNDLRKCQETVAKAGGLYVKKKLKAVQKCMNSFQKEKITGPDPITVCRGSMAGMTHIPPTDQKTADKIAKVETKVADLLTKKCTDGLVAQLDSCATNVSDLIGCVITDHWSIVDSLVQTQYGDLIPTSDSGEQKCQKTIANEGFKYVTKSLKASQKCLDKRNKDGIGGDGAALCIGSVSAAIYTPPTDEKAALKIGKADTKLHDKVTTKCTTTQLAALDSCGSDPMAQSDCTLCLHRAAFVDLLDTQYGGSSGGE